MTTDQADGYIDEKNKKASVFSIHAHPDGTRIATGGLGMFTFMSTLSMALTTRLTSQNMEYSTDTVREGRGKS